MSNCMPVRKFNMLTTVSGSIPYKNNTEVIQMGQRINRQQAITAEELLRVELLVNQALINILISKQIISEKELLHSIQKLRLEHERMNRWQS